MQYAIEAFGQTKLGMKKKKLEHTQYERGQRLQWVGECPVYDIMMIGRWTRDAFLLYIRKQVEYFRHTVSSKMLRFPDTCQIESQESQNLTKDNVISQSLPLTKKNVPVRMAQQIPMTPLPLQVDARKH